MCGRYTLTAEQEVLIRRFSVRAGLAHAFAEIRKRYNIAPSQGVPAIRQNRETGERETAVLTWGLVPFWARDPSIAYKMINARSETAATKPAYRGPIRHKRCLLPASGFYEWQRLDSGRGPRQPFFIFPKDAKAGEGLLAFAGLWEHWGAPDGSEIESCTILTTEANDDLAELHHRMPVILDSADWDRWLDTTLETPEAVADLLRPSPNDRLRKHPVSVLVNSPRHDQPELLERVDATELPGRQTELF